MKKLFLCLIFLMSSLLTLVLFSEDVVFAQQRNEAQEGMPLLPIFYKSDFPDEQEGVGQDGLDENSATMVDPSKRSCICRAVVGDDMGFCNPNDIQDAEECRDQYRWYKAFLTADEHYCDSIIDEEFRLICKAQMLNDISLCKSAIAGNFESAEELHDFVLVCNAIANHNGDACNNVVDEQERAACFDYWHIFRALKSMVRSDCEEITSQDKKDFCFAFVENDISQCDKIK